MLHWITMTYAIYLFLLFLFFKVTEEANISCYSGSITTISNFGHVYSDGYHESRSYPQETISEVTIIVKEGKYIRLTFDDIDISANNCNWERLIVYDVTDDSRTIVAGLYCGKVKVPDYVTMGNRAIIKFESSLIGTGRGYHITFRATSSPAICQPGEYQCRNRLCIPAEEVDTCDGEDDCGDGTDEENCGSDYPKYLLSQCGIPEVEPVTTEIDTDRVAIMGSWPWQVDIQINAAQPDGHLCGGSLIHPQWFVTSAHCIVPILTPFVFARIHVGKHHRYKADPYEQIRYIQDFFVYRVDKEEFLKTGEYNLLHDLALVKLNAPVTINPHVQIVCLPEADEELKIGDLCFSTGWGSTRSDRNGSGDNLKQTAQVVQEGEKCSDLFIEYDAKTMICTTATSESLDGLCHGDRGGPLVCKKGERWLFYGATTISPDVNFKDAQCDSHNKTKAFVKISPKIQWINDIIANN